MIIIINDLVLIIMFKYERKPKKNTILNTNQVNIEKSIQLNKSNINIFDEFFLISEVKNK